MTLLYQKLTLCNLFFEQNPWRTQVQEKKNTEADNTHDVSSFYIYTRALLTLLLQSERPKLYTILAFLNAIE